MQRKCRICALPYLEQIHRDVRSGMTTTKIARIYGLSCTSLTRHIKDHMRSDKEDKLERERREEREQQEAKLTQETRELMADFETLLTHPRGFDLREATPVQRAIARLSDGKPLGELEEDPDVIEAFGFPAAWPEHMAREFGIICAIRTGKSLIAAARAVHATQHVDVFHLGPGEVPRVSVLSLRKDLADVLLDHIRGHIRESAHLRSLVISEAADTIVMRHPTGRPIEIQVVAGQRAGGSTVARWCAGLILDEAPRMNGSDESVVNFDDVVHATQGRLLPGAQIFYIGSPWVPAGPVYELVKANFGKPTPERIICWARGPVMNPSWWTEARCAELELRDPIAYQTDVLAQFAAMQDGLFPPHVIGPCIRKRAGHVEPVPEGQYIAAMDPATRGDAWALVIVRRDLDRMQVVAIRQWKGTPKTPLSPDYVLSEISRLCSVYHVTAVWTDQYSSDAVRDIALHKGLSVVIEPSTAVRNVQRFDSLRQLMADQRIELPDDSDFLIDLKRVRRVATQSGVSIEMPRVSGRHCDYAAALALACSRPTVGSMWEGFGASRAAGLSPRTCPGLTDWGNWGGLQTW